RSYRAFERALIGSVDPRPVIELALVHRLARPIFLNLCNSLRPNVSGLMSNPILELVRHDVCFSLWSKSTRLIISSALRQRFTTNTPWLWRGVFGEFI